MKKENTIDKLWEKLKDIGEQEKEMIEVSDIVTEVITKLIKARNDKNLTQRDLAKISNINQVQIARIESLQTNPTLNTLARYAYHVGTTITCKSKYENNYVQLAPQIPQKYNTTYEQTRYNFEQAAISELNLIFEDEFECGGH